MLAGYHPLFQALLGSLLTWGLTAAGAALVFLFEGGQRKVLDGSLGFAAGVMLAASYWSLLAPSIEMAEISGLYGNFVFLPVSLGFAGGAAFVYFADLLLPMLGFYSSDWIVAVHSIKTKPVERLRQSSMSDEEEGQDEMETTYTVQSEAPAMQLRQRGVRSREASGNTEMSAAQELSWRRIFNLIVAITVHNIPEGLAVGVGFGAVGKSPSATLESARNLAIGIGIQNFPEGLAVSLPLHAAGVDMWRSFWYGQLSGTVEPFAAVFGAFTVTMSQPLLPYALAFAAGAMVYVVVHDIIPESHKCGNGQLSSIGVIVGFVIMMSLDVGLG